MLRHGSSFVDERLIFLMQMFKWAARGTWNWAGHTCVLLLQTGHVTAGGAADGSCARVASQLCKVVLLGFFIMYHWIREMLPTFCNSEFFSWQIKEMLVICYLKTRNILKKKKNIRWIKVLFTSAAAHSRLHAGWEVCLWKVQVVSSPVTEITFCGLLISGKIAIWWWTAIVFACDWLTRRVGGNSIMLLDCVQIPNITFLKTAAHHKVESNFEKEFPASCAGPRSSHFIVTVIYIQQNCDIRTVVATAQANQKTTHVISTQWSIV